MKVYVVTRTCWNPRYHNYKNGSFIDICGSVADAFILVDKEFDRLRSLERKETNRMKLDDGSIVIETIDNKQNYVAYIILEKEVKE